jgi:hypothetical protein
MSYRNDHDAALHRVDALEGELARLRKLHDKTETPPPKKAPTRTGLFVASLLIGACTVAVAARSFRAGFADASVYEPEPVQAASGHPAGLRACADAIRSPAARFDAITTDPRRGTAEPVSAIVPTGATCRDTMRGWAGTTNRDLIERVGVWAASEDQLAGAISRILVYYESDPYLLDNYATAAQLWREYDAAISARDRALVRVRPIL